MSGRLGRLVCLGLTVLLLTPWSSLASSFWCSPFETESGQAVTQDQIADAVDNMVGPAGTAAGSSTSLAPLIYVAHGQFTPAVPTAIDPAGQTSGFAISTPDDRGTGINTNLRSDSGNLGTNLTFEGYFYMPSGTAITSPTYVGRRLVTQKRTALDDNSRLAIGVHANLVGATGGLYDYEGFNYTGTDLSGQAGGTGWGGAWGNSTTLAELSNDSVSLDSDAFPFAPTGSRMACAGNMTGARVLSHPVNFSVEGGVTYMSFLVRRGVPTSTTSASDIQFQLRTNGDSIRYRFGITSAGAFFSTFNASSVPTADSFGTVAADTVYFVVIKLVSSASGSDQAFVKVYAPTDTVPTVEPATWDKTSTGATSDTTNKLRINVGANNSMGEMDEIRVGSTYGSATDPDAPIANPGEYQNFLSIFWTAASGDPVTITNHLEFGTTQLLASTWYHFALTYDGSDIRWYLNGLQEGVVLSAPLAGVGTAKIVLANNRMSGTDDRGFYGVLDEFRIYDRALPPSEFMENGGLPGSNLLWQSRFETNAGAAVTSQQEANTLNCIDNTVGVPNGSPAGITASTYTAYGSTNVPAIPATIDPAGLAGSFAIFMPDAPNPAIDTNIASNSGSFANAMTVQGYFNSFQTSPITVTVLGDRLVSTSRASAQNKVRLAIGLTGNADDSPTYNVLGIAGADQSGNVGVVRGTTQIVANTWYHFALVWDGTDVRFYLNGVQEGEVLAPPLASPGTATIAIGNDIADATGARGFYGLLDKIVISDDVIPVAEFMTAGYDPCSGIRCNRPFADFDGDHDVDMIDFSSYQLCVSLTALPDLDPCLCFDRNDDLFVNTTDVAEFLKCATGPGIVWSATLAPDCAP
jgi:hypothetical protein